MNLGLIRRAALLAAPILTAVAMLAPAPASASGEEVALDAFPTEKLNDRAALQHGAQLFVNYCLGCHSLKAVRYNRLKDLGLTDQQIKDNLMFTGQKVGDMMTIAMQPANAKDWFGALPPDLSVEARARSSGAGSGADWIYTFLRTFYRDNGRATGWNNVVFPNVGMPNPFWALQGTRPLVVTDIKGEGDGHGGALTQTVTHYGADGMVTVSEGKPSSEHPHIGRHFEFEPAVGGTLNRLQFDDTVADLTAFLTYVSDPSAKTRIALGVWVLIFLAVLFTIALWLNRTYWKDIK
ncbi:MAG: cytochrome c1 [Burkholderiaceae bacterium]